jgi:hypothetical protein
MRLKMSRNHMIHLHAVTEIDELPDRPEDDEPENDHSEEKHVRSSPIA